MKKQSPKQMQKQWSHLIERDIVKSNPILTPGDIQKIYNLFLHYSNQNQVCMIRDMIKTADMLNYSQKKSIFYQCLLKLDSENPSKPFTFLQMIQAITDKLGNPFTQQGRKSLMKLLGLEDEETLGFSDILKISDYLRLDMNPYQIQQLIDQLNSDRPNSRSVSWNRFNEYINKKVRKSGKEL